MDNTLRWTLVASILLLQLTGCGEGNLRSQVPAGEESEAFPDLDPFVRSPWRQLLDKRLRGGEDEGGHEPGSETNGRRVPDPGELRQLLSKIDETNKRFEVDRGDAAPGPRHEDSVTAWLQPALDMDQKLVLMLLPDALQGLRGLWHEDSWTERELEYANLVSQFVRRIEDAPRVTFATGEDRKNQDHLSALVRFFNASVKRPERLAAMLFTLDDGPFSGLPVTLPDGLAPIDRRTYGQNKEIRLYVLPGEEDAERHVLAGFAGDERLWTRLMSSEPRSSIKSVRFGAKTRKFGNHGWSLDLVVRWTFGHEAGSLYVDPDGGFLFYFLSW